MTAAQNILHRREKAKKQLDDLFKRSDMVNVIHYSCESFDESGKSSSIISIAIRNLENGQIRSFSIHMVAERHNYSPDEISEKLQEFEKEMLSEFYEFVESRTNYWWLHWNMYSSTYGFQAISHRYRVLGGEPKEIDEHYLFDLSRILVNLYGPKYIEHPRIMKLLELNPNLIKPSILSGDQEAEAIRNQEYIKACDSTNAKVSFFSDVAELAWDKSLRTNTTWRDRNGTSLRAWMNNIMETTVFKFLGVLGIILAPVGFILQLIQQ